MTDLLVPLLLLFFSVCALRQKQDVYSLLVSGAREGLGVLLTVAPALIVLLSAVSMLRASGFLDKFGVWAAPVCAFFGIPSELVPLMLIRPLSGGAALAVGAELIAAHGPDSLVGRTAAVMLGSTETTFYAIGVYFGAAGVKKTRYAVPAAVCADLTGFLMASLSVRWIMR
jgi:spore maturation protein B